jgi:hypothetical protein
LKTKLFTIAQLAFHIMENDLEDYGMMRSDFKMYLASMPKSFHVAIESRLLIHK